MSLITGLKQGTTGEEVPVLVDSSGRLVVTGVTGGTSSGGSSDTTETTQLQVLAKATSIDSKVLTNAQLRDTPLNVAVTSNTLPSGAATATNQTTANTSLNSIDTKTPALVSGAVPITASARTCVGRQTITLTSGVVAILTVPVGAIAAIIQADGATVRVTQDGTTTPTSTVGMRIDDGVMYPIDTSLSSVKLLSQNNCSVQVCYFDKA